MERNYEFRKRLLEVHKKDMRDDLIYKALQGCVVDNTWEIVYKKNADRVMVYAARDLQDYFAVSLGVTIRLREACDLVSECKSPAKKLILTTVEISPELAFEHNETAAFRLCVTDGIILCGNSSRGVAQGCYYIEDIMNGNQGPVIAIGEVSRKPLFSPRMVHSGYGMDVFPDEHLKAIAHAGMDAILIFTKDVDLTPHGYVDFNDLIDRAAGFGIDVYAYSYYISEKHPDEPDAREHYEST